MNTGTRVLAFVVGVAAVFGLAIGVGQLVGPLDVAPETRHDGAAHDSAAHDGAAHDESGHEGETAAVPAGLASSTNGYSLRLAATRSEAGAAVPLTFVIEGPDGTPVTEFDVTHEERLHLIAVRRDTTGFQHVHPTLDAEGTWRTELDLSPGTWRIFADFRASGAEPMTLGTDLSVPGRFTPVAHRDEVRTSTVDGYTVTLSGDLATGAGGPLTVKVSRDGKPVTDLQPYLGAYGHLVALRSSDLAYLHVHPEGTPGDGTTQPGPRIGFHAAAPSTDTYRLFLDFRHGDVVRTAEFTLASTSAEGAHHDHEH